MPELPKKIDRVQQELSALHALRETPRAPESLARLRHALADKSNFVVAAAAEVVAAAELVELLPLLPPAFERFLIAPARTDKGCKAKFALADALYRNDSQDAALFRIGLRHVQPEPIWGGQQDTAAELRGLCALALAHISPPDVIEELADLLADKEPTARALCARALGASGRQEAVPLLRYKIRIGDPSAEVLLECFAALLSLVPARALPICAAVLDEDDEVRREAAALALGQSRRQEALPLLTALAERAPMSERRTPLLAIAMLRSSAAFEYLMQLVQSAPTSLAALAIRALAVHRYDDALHSRVREAAKKRDDSSLLHTVDEAFAGR
jgi:HEAT repeat protein